MKSKIMSLASAMLLFGTCSYAQNQTYDSWIQKADSLMIARQFGASALCYSEAFRSNAWKGYGEDRYKAAQMWSMCSIPDSAFFNLFRLTEKMNFDNLERVVVDPYLISLHDHPRWESLIASIKANQPTHPELKRTLEAIYEEDQKYRVMMDSVVSKFGNGSPETQNLWHTIMEKDSMNQIQVLQILDTFGWLGAKAIGTQANSALFLVIQHAGLPIQEKYLPMMREAVIRGDARGSSLALLEDRVLMRNGKKQIYGSQIRTNASGQPEIFPIEDPENVDKRRASVGLYPLAEYVSIWGLTWDAAAMEKMKTEKGE